MVHGLWLSHHQEWDSDCRETAVSFYENIPHVFQDVSTLLMIYPMNMPLIYIHISLYLHNMVHIPRYLEKKNVNQSSRAIWGWFPLSNSLSQFPSWGHDWVARIYPSSTGTWEKKKTTMIPADIPTVFHYILTIIQHYSISLRKIRHAWDPTWIIRLRQHHLGGKLPHHAHGSRRALLEGDLPGE